MKKLHSIFVDDEHMNTCLITGMTTDVERHHIFEGLQGHKKLSEKYNFICPLHSSIHHGARMRFDNNWKDLDHWLKRMCQEWYVEVAHIGDKQDWFNEFGKFYDDRADENVWLNGEWKWDLRKEK